MNSILLTVLVVALMGDNDSLNTKICLHNHFECTNVEYSIPVPNNYVDAYTFDGGWERLYKFIYEGNAILYITNDGGWSLNIEKLNSLLPSYGLPGNHFITGNETILFGRKDIPKEIYDDGLVPRTILFAGEDEGGYWSDYQTPHINVGYINATREQRAIFEDVIKYIINYIPNPEVINY